jgi:hypothetical protein
MRPPLFLRNSGFDCLESRPDSSTVSPGGPPLPLSEKFVYSKMLGNSLTANSSNDWSYTQNPPGKGVTADFVSSRAPRP